MIRGQGNVNSWLFQSHQACMQYMLTHYPCKTDRIPQLCDPMDKILTLQRPILGAIEADKNDGQRFIQLQLTLISALLECSTSAKAAITQHMSSRLMLLLACFPDDAKRVFPPPGVSSSLLHLTIIYGRLESFTFASRVGSDKVAASPHIDSKPKVGLEFIPSRHQKETRWR